MALTFRKLHPLFAAEVGPIDLRYVHDSEALEQALELNVPALPLQFAGGDSREFWKL